MKINVLTALIGFLTAFMGVNVILNPISYDTKFMRIINLTAYKWPFGIALIVFSLFVFWSEYRRIKKLKDNTDSSSEE
jgi:chromate transport protein ChrA